MSDESEGSGKQVIARAVAILKALEADPSGVTLAQLTRMTELPRTTVQRLVSALEAQQMVMVQAQKIRLGSALARLAAAAHTDIIPLARPALEALGKRTRETVDLCVFKGAHAISVDQYSSDRELRVVSPVGTAFPVHTTAHGKAMLAALPGEMLEKLFSEPLEKRTDFTLTRQQLRDQLAVIRREGFATDQQEHARGVCGIGVALRLPMSERYALSLAVPALRFAEDKEDLLAALLQCRAEIEALVGGGDESESAAQ